MSATPIPRSLSFALYGEIDVSCIKTKPKDRKEIITSIINKKIEDLIDGIKEKLKIMNRFFGYYLLLVMMKMKMKMKQQFQGLNIFLKFLKMKLL